MKKQFLCFVFAIFMSCTPHQKKQNKTLQTNDFNFVVEQNLKWKALNSYVGKYSKDTDFFKNKLVRFELKKILDNDYEDYMEFVESAGYGIIDKVDDIIYTEVSVMHVNGYNSLLFINTKELEMHLFWMNGSIGDNENKIYGKKPIPERVKKIILDDLNTGWGHVAEFDFVENGLEINLLNPTANDNRKRD